MCSFYLLWKVHEKIVQKVELMNHRRPGRPKSTLSRGAWAADVKFVRKALRRLDVTQGTLASEPASPPDVRKRPTVGPKDRSAVLNFFKRPATPKSRGLVFVKLRAIAERLGQTALISDLDNRTLELIHSRILGQYGRSDKADAEKHARVMDARGAAILGENLASALVRHKFANERKQGRIALLIARELWDAWYHTRFLERSMDEAAFDAAFEDSKRYIDWKTILDPTGLALQNEGRRAAKLGGRQQIVEPARERSKRLGNDR